MVFFFLSVPGSPDNSGPGKVYDDMQSGVFVSCFFGSLFKLELLLIAFARITWKNQLYF